MYRIVPVRDLDLPDLEPYRTMRAQREHRLRGIFVSEGEKIVRRLLESPLEILSLLLPERWAEAYAGLLARRPENFAVYTAPKNLLENLTGFSMYQGVLAAAKIPPPTRIEAALAQSPQPQLFVAVEGLSSAENLGGLVRNCVAFGASALIVGETCCSPYLRRAVRGSMGTIFKLPVIETESLQKTIRFAQSRGVRVIAAHPHADCQNLSAAHFVDDSVIVLGSEGQGLSLEILNLCDEAVAIPMANEVDSLNVADAGAVLLYEANRQRQSIKT
jgi:tRNA G18 (ribose-2'-O)-methylase SpoU